MKVKTKLFFFLLTLILIFSACTSTWIPEEGYWICEELQIHLDFDNGDFYFQENGEKNKCTISNDRGSEWISVIKIYPDKGSSSDDIIFTAQYVLMTDREYIVKEYYTGVEYTFVRQDLPE